MDHEEIQSHNAFGLQWYYSIELARGLFTNGIDPAPVAQTRELLRHVDVEAGGGARCLDLGLQEGLVDILLERRGASEVVGYDRALRQSRLGLVRRALGTGFDLIGGMKLRDLPAALFQQGRRPFDLVVFSGLLYHMFDPLGGIAVARGLVRDGGICLVETTAVFEDSDTMHFNRGGRFTAHGLWFVTPRCLEYLLRFLHLEPIDVVHLAGRGRRPEYPGTRPPGRVAIACRATDEPATDPAERWVTAKNHRLDSSEFLDWDAVTSDAPEVGYNASRPGLVRHADGSVDVESTVESTAPMEPDEHDIQLTLDARY